MFSIAKSSQRNKYVVYISICRRFAGKIKDYNSNNTGNYQEFSLRNYGFFMQFHYNKYIISYLKTLNFNL